MKLKLAFGLIAFFIATCPHAFGCGSPEFRDSQGKWRNNCDGPNSAAGELLRAYTAWTCVALPATKKAREKYEQDCYRYVGVSATQVGPEYESLVRAGSAAGEKSHLLLKDGQELVSALDHKLKSMKKARSPKKTMQSQMGFDEEGRCISSLENARKRTEAALAAMRTEELCEPK